MKETSFITAFFAGTKMKMFPSNSLLAKTDIARGSFDFCNEYCNNLNTK